MKIYDKVELDDKDIKRMIKHTSVQASYINRKKKSLNTTLTILFTVLCGVIITLGVILHSYKTGSGISVAFSHTANAESEIDDETIKDIEHESEIQSLSATYKGEAITGRAIDLSQAYLIAIYYNRDIVKIPISDKEVIVPPEIKRPLKEGANKFTITYKGKTATLTVDTQQKK